jgi:calcium-dependent protein kinase
MIMAEVFFISNLSHSNIVKYGAVYESDRHLFIETELLSGGTLEEMIDRRGNVPDKMAAIIMRQIFSAVSYLHEKNIVHRDIKPENIMFVNSKEYKVKLIDFGLSGKIDSDRSKAWLESSCGTVTWMAPE